MNKPGKNISLRSSLFLNSNGSKTCFDFVAFIDETSLPQNKTGWLIIPHLTLSVSIFRRKG